MFKTISNPQFESLFQYPEDRPHRETKGIRGLSRNPDLFARIWDHGIDESLSRQRSSDVAFLRLTGPDGEKVPVCRKRYWYPSLRDRFKGFLRNTFFGMSRARREFRSLSTLYDIGCSVIRPVACGEERTLRLLGRAFIVTEVMPGTRTLEMVLRSTPHSIADRRILAARLGCWVRSFHDRGFRDRDLLSRNILVHETRTGIAFSKIDSGKARGGNLPPGSGKACLRDLADLARDTAPHVSRQDMLRSLLAYLAAHRIDGQVRWYIERIATLAESAKN